MDFKTILVALAMGLVLTACNKEGEGGTSIISGTLIGQNHSSSKSEVTEVIITNGLEVEHGDYWLLNSPSTNNYFYIWYDNPTWVSNGDPTLNGRTGIPITCNEIAEKIIKKIKSQSKIKYIKMRIGESLDANIYAKTHYKLLDKINYKLKYNNDDTLDSCIEYMRSISRNDLKTSYNFFINKK